MDSTAATTGANAVSVVVVVVEGADAFAGSVAAVLVACAGGACCAAGVSQGTSLCLLKHGSEQLRGRWGTCQKWRKVRERERERDR